MRQKCYLTLATGRVWLISSHMGSDVGQIFPTASLHRDHSILYALVCEEELSRMGKNGGIPDLVCKNDISTTRGDTGHSCSLLEMGQAVSNRLC